MGQRSEAPARDINFGEGPVRSSREPKHGKIWQNIAQHGTTFVEIWWHEWHRMTLDWWENLQEPIKFSHFPMKKRGLSCKLSTFFTNPLFIKSCHGDSSAASRFLGSQACRRFQPSKERVVDHLSWGMAKCAWHCWFLHQRVKRSVILMGNWWIWNLENLVLLYLLFIGFWCKACNWCYSIDYHQYIPSTFCICPSPVI